MPRFLVFHHFNKFLIGDSSSSSSTSASLIMPMSAPCMKLPGLAEAHTTLPMYWVRGHSGRMKIQRFR